MGSVREVWALAERIDGGRRRLLGDGLLGVLLAAPLVYPRLTPALYGVLDNWRVWAEDTGDGHH